jgi:hypothetical protein
VLPSPAPERVGHGLAHALRDRWRHPRPQPIADLDDLVEPDTQRAWILRAAPDAEAVVGPAPGRRPVAVEPLLAIAAWLAGGGVLRGEDGRRGDRAGRLALGRPSLAERAVGVRGAKEIAAELGLPVGRQGREVRADVVEERRVFTTRARSVVSLR